LFKTLVFQQIKTVSLLFLKKKREKRNENLKIELDDGLQKPLVD
jgi:hypothetical protein